MSPHTPCGGEGASISVCVVKFGVLCVLVLLIMGTFACGRVEELELRVQCKDGAGRSHLNVETNRYDGPPYVLRYKLVGKWTVGEVFEAPMELGSDDRLHLTDPKDIALIGLCTDNWAPES